MSVGFDFGTTNSLVSVVVGDRAIDIFDEEGRPHPSVVRYEGEDVVVGHEARQALDEAGLGVHGSTVRSPKIFLGEEVITVGGVERNPIDIVSDVVRHVRTESLLSPQREVLGSLSRAMVTIPVTMNGPRRAALREAFGRADITVTQFVHEPLAALYGHVRGAADPSAEIRRLMRRNVLVVDWGGGTLDLTLCRIDSNQILQVRNGGSDEVGGDYFDRVVRDEVIKRFAVRAGLSSTDLPRHEARLRMLQEAERNKIELSDRQSVTFYRPGFFAESGTTLEYKLSRQELDEITRPLVAAGINSIESLLDSVDMAPAQISMCLVAGGMAAMPSIRSRLHQLFGPERVVVPENAATLISQGAAWISHDMQSLRLAKPIELEMARGSRLPLVKAGSEMPDDTEVKTDTVHLFCTDPSDGVAKFMIVAPRGLKTHYQVSDPRTALGALALAVDHTAPPLHERLTLDVEIDQDLIFTLRAASAQKGDVQEMQLHDLEFALGLPGDIKPGPVDANLREPVPRRPRGGLAVRANVADTTDQTLVPGDVLHRHRPNAFARGFTDRPATAEQLTEYLYYKPCAVCRRKWGDPACKCASGR